MSTVSSKLELFQAAMPMVGANVPSSLDDQTPEAIAANAIYEIMVAEALGRHAWSFSTKEAALTYQGETGYYPAYAYTLPSDVLTPRAVMQSGTPFRDFEMRGGKLICNVAETTGLSMIYTWRSDESDWSPSFVKALVTQLAGHLCNGLLDRPQQGEALDQKAEALLRRAMRNDRSTFQGSEVVPDPVLLGAWKGTRGQRSQQGLAANGRATSS